MSTDRLQSQANGAAMPARRLAFGTPVGVSAVAVVAVAIIAGLLLFGPRGLFGLGLAPSPTPEPVTPSPTASAVATPTPEVTPSSTPTWAPTPPATPTPDPTPTPVAQWTGLEWSNGAVVTGKWVVYDAIFWNGSWIGVGRSADAADYGAAFYRSDDGRHWSVSDRGRPGLGWPEHIVPTSHGLLAVSIFEPRPALLWASSDGMTWAAVDSPTWRAAMAPSGSIWGESIVGGAAGVIVIGDREEDAPTRHVRPLVLHSIDGFTWTTVALGADFDHARFESAAAFDEGFVVTGSDDVTPIDTLHWTSRPAAWYSPDGMTWSTAAIEGEAVPFGVLVNVEVGVDGMTAEGLGVPGANDGDTARWASADGLTWRVTGPVGWEQFGGGSIGSDGTRIIALATNPSSQQVMGWVSTDGNEWNSLAMSGATDLGDWPIDSTNPWEPQGSPLWVGQSGVVVQGHWFGSAQE